ncbi:SHC-transforming protein 1 isoform X1 [Pseudonaja textilis]|uniref:SHC-transforming protein 1 isoform X1 n=2 Tax=Pseudonaja textilis TaxID=8673 RepID=UPI000EA849FD|nr:SHC-transforming protein 1 isoform X1 [Pseudonaja textilis]
MDLLPKSKYTPLQEESPSSLDDGSPAAEGDSSPDPSSSLLLPAPSLTGSSSSSSLSPMLPAGDPESEGSPTTLCSFFPKMATLKFSNPAFLLNLRPFSRDTGVSGDPPASGGSTAAAAAAFPDSPMGLVGLYSQDMNKLSCGKKMRVEGGQLGGEEWTRHGSFVNKPSRGWLHRDDKVMGSGVSYLVRYMGCVEVLQSMRALDFSTRTQVTREAIGLVCEAVPSTKGAVRRRKQPCGRALNSILGKTNLKFAAMPITLTISTNSLNLMASDCKQIIANHHMQSISFASGGDPDTAEYVAYVAKDPVNHRACHILECPEGLSQDVISTIGQAFELRFKQYLKNPPKLVTPHDRMAGFDGSAWDEEEEPPPPDHQYYNDFPGKEPPLGGVVDLRLREGAAAAQTPNNLGATLPVGQVVAGDYESKKPHSVTPGRDRGPPGRTEFMVDPSYVNVQNLEKLQPGLQNATSNGSVQRDLFDMKPFEDALRAPPPPPTPPSHPPATMEEQLRREPWYHGQMSRKESEKLLQANGDFLVRESTTTPGQYVLTGLQGGHPKHLLLVDPEGVVRTKDHRFESVSHLISHHMDNRLPIISAGSELCLQQPVERRQ